MLTRQGEFAIACALTEKFRRTAFHLTLPLKGAFGNEAKLLVKVHHEKT